MADHKENHDDKNHRDPQDDDEPVTVGFSPPDRWRFGRPRAPGARPGRLTLVPDASDPAWRFESAEVVDGGDEVAVHVDPRGTRLVITDRGPRAGAYQYRVVVSLDGTSYASPPQSSAPGGGGRGGDPGAEEDVAARTLLRRPPQIVNEA